MRILALGDSYTIGEGVDARERWPVQLAERLRQSGTETDAVRIIATTGWTTDELLAAIDAAAPEGEWDLVTLLIGVNDQYRGRPVAEYVEGFRSLLAVASRFAGERGRVLVISIPDWGCTPFAVEKGRDAATVAREIDAYNAAARHECGIRGLPFVDVTGISRKAASDPGLLAADGLHPSGAMYELWSERIFEAIT